MGTSAKSLCERLPPPFRAFTEAVLALKFDEEPKYEACIALFEPLLGAVASRPIIIEAAAKVKHYVCNEIPPIAGLLCIVGIITMKQVIGAT